ncbi:hypothetical protein IW261DRAFT_1555580 [Armillaria novae-zelandiae]|uniref:Uncharacterized protein n=1 Tax=Armillaria novae-zelandiae TaxID=153914 RepID=A0AA39PVE3_9AGAR|nr:hypothetical protein IW261DRAFT_1555580 [Armillaria novae-zelandiae]
MQSSPSLNGPAVTNTDSVPSQMPITVPDNEHNTSRSFDDITGHLSRVSNTTMVTTAESTAIPIPCTPTEEAAERHFLQDCVARLVRYLDELKHKSGDQDYVHDSYIVNEANIERLRTRVQFLDASIGSFDKGWTAAPEDRDGPAYMAEVMVVETTNCKGGYAASKQASMSVVTTGDIHEDDTINNPYNKPLGEPNRPNSGGYSLVDKLIKDGKWTKQQYQGVMDRVHEMAKNELNISLSYREQSEKKKLKICEQMAREYPILQRYPDIWPVRDFLKVYLKSTSAFNRHQN